MDIGPKQLVLGAAAFLFCFFQAGSLASKTAHVAHWVIDPNRTQISFSIDAVGYPETRGVFRQFIGQIDIDFDRPSRSDVAFDVKSQSVDVGSGAFGDLLRTAPFLDADHFTDITFQSTNVEKVADDVVRVTGNLGMLGQTRPLTVDVHVSAPEAKTNRRVSFTAHATIDRLAFGMTAGYPLISKDVDIVIASEAVEQ